MTKINVGEARRDIFVVLHYGCFERDKIRSGRPGKWRSLQSGVGVYPAGFREALPEDDIHPTDIDWLESERTGVLHVNTYYANSKLQVWLLCDVSLSMLLGRKAERAARVAGAVSYSAGVFGDQLNVFAFKPDGLYRFPREVVRSPEALYESLQAYNRDNLWRDMMPVNEGLSTASYEAIAAGATSVFLVSDFHRIERWESETAQLANVSTLFPIVIRMPAEENILHPPSFLKAQDPESGEIVSVYLFGKQKRLAAQKQLDRWNSHIAESLTSLVGYRPFFYGGRTTMADLAVYCEERRETQ
jgi:uncharacterized protein (DUF58 family)